MATALPQYGQLQRDLAPHSDRLLALGVADMRPAVMPRRFEEALETVGDHVERRGTANDRPTPSSSRRSSSPAGSARSPAP